MQDEGGHGRLHWTGADREGEALRLHAVRLGDQGGRRPAGSVENQDVGNAVRPQVGYGHRGCARRSSERLRGEAAERDAGAGQDVEVRRSGVRHGDGRGQRCVIQEHEVLAWRRVGGEQRHRPDVRPP